ncbi:MAG TPA: hypothetical protein VMS17_24805 [Gemmataceae bacterium]|nr:hypothetical protein [Gemmataceae bacterium]
MIDRLKDKLAAPRYRKTAGMLWTAVDVLMGLRYERSLVEQLLRGVREMEESVTYQAIVEKGVAKGELQGARRILLHQGEQQFGTAASADVRSKIEGVNSLEALESVADRLLRVRSWDELLADVAAPEPRRGRRKGRGPITTAFTCRAGCKERRVSENRNAGPVKCNASLGPVLFHHMVNFLDAPAFATQMQHRVTVGTDWPQVLDRIDDILAVDLRQGAQMMDVDITVGYLPVHGPEAEPADAASRAVGVDALAARLRIALVGIHRDRAHRALDQTAWLKNLLSQDRISYHVPARPRQVSPQRLLKCSEVNHAFSREGDPISDHSRWDWIFQQGPALPQIELRENAPTISTLFDRADRRVADDAEVVIACVDEHLIPDLDIVPVLADVPIKIFDDPSVLKQRPVGIDCNRNGLAVAEGEGPIGTRRNRIEPRTCHWCHLRFRHVWPNW